MTKTKFKASGFTFIEVMIAITVFSIGVLAILNLVMRNLDTIDKVQLRTSATLLAKEGIEIAYNVRNSNNQKGFEWDCILKNAEDISHLTIGDEAEKICSSNFSDGINGDVFQASFAVDEYHFIKKISVKLTNEEDMFDKLFEENRLYLYTGTSENQSLSWHGYEDENLSGDATYFARYLLFTGVKNDDEILPTENILKVESHILIKKGSYKNEIILESFISSL